MHPRPHDPARPTSTDFSEADRQYLAALKADLRRWQAGCRPESESIYRSALHYREIRDRSLHRIDGVRDFDRWAKQTFGMRGHQLRKYFNIGGGLTLKGVQGMHQGVDAMEQIALALPVLQPTMW